MKRKHRLITSCDTAEFNRNLERFLSTLQPNTVIYETHFSTAATVSEGIAYTEYSYLCVYADNN